MTQDIIIEEKFWLADAHCDTVTVLTPWRLAFGGRDS